MISFCTCASYLRNSLLLPDGARPSKVGTVDPIKHDENPGKRRLGENNPNAGCKIKDLPESAFPKLCF